MAKPSAIPERRSPKHERPAYPQENRHVPDRPFADLPVPRHLARGCGRRRRWQPSAPIPRCCCRPRCFSAGLPSASAARSALAAQISARSCSAWRSGWVTAAAITLLTPSLGVTGHRPPPWPAWSSWCSASAEPRADQQSAGLFPGPLQLLLFGARTRFGDLCTARRCGRDRRRGLRGCRRTTQSSLDQPAAPPRRIGPVRPPWQFARKRNNDDRQSYRRGRSRPPLLLGLAAMAGTAGSLGMLSPAAQAAAAISPLSVPWARCAKSMPATFASAMPKWGRKAVRRSSCCTAGPMTSTAFVEVAPLLAAAGYRVIVPSPARLRHDALPVGRHAAQRPAGGAGRRRHRADGRARHRARRWSPASTGARAPPTSSPRCGPSAAGRWSRSAAI